MSSFYKKIVVNCQNDKLWQIITDIRGMADLYTFMHISDYKQEENIFSYTRKLDIPGLASLSWQERSVIEKPNIIRFQAIEGDLKDFTGFWQIENDGTPSLVLNIDYNIPSGIGPNVPAFMAEAVLGQIFQKIMETIKSKAETE
jgi:uncharacterized membrane protein